MSNPVISAITLPSGTTYDIKDAFARSAIENLQNTENVLSTDAASTPYGVTWKSGSTTITGTLVASADTTKKIYLVPLENPEGKNSYEEYLTVKTGSTTYAWEMIGTTETDLSGLGALAYKDSASASYTPAGSVSQPTFTGSSSTVTITAEASESGNYTPAGNISAPTISVSSAGSTTTVNSITDVGTLPSLTTTVSSEVLTIGFSQGTLPTKGADTTVKTGDATYSATAPTFTGTKTQLSGSTTAAGSVSQPTFSGTAATITAS